MTRFLGRAVALRVGGYAALLALTFAAAFVIGGRLDSVGAAPADQQAHEADQEHVGAHGEGPDERTAAALPGLAVSQDGYTLVPRSTALRRGDAVTYEFTIEDPDGQPLQSYRRSHEKELHLIVVRRDLTAFEHLHPRRSAEGTWSVS